MSKRHPNPRLAKIHRNYTVEEVAGLYGVHRNTVREWVRRGLPTIDDRRPMLIVGTDNNLTSNVSNPGEQIPFPVVLKNN